MKSKHFLVLHVQMITVSTANPKDHVVLSSILLLLLSNKEYHIIFLNQQNWLKSLDLIKVE